MIESFLEIMIKASDPGLDKAGVEAKCDEETDKYRRNELYFRYKRFIDRDDPNGTMLASRYLKNEARRISSIITAIENSDIQDILYCMTNYETAMILHICDEAACEKFRRNMSNRLWRLMLAEVHAVGVSTVLNEKCLLGIIDRFWNEVIPEARKRFRERYKKDTDRYMDTRKMLYYPPDDNDTVHIKEALNKYSPTIGIVRWEGKKLSRNARPMQACQFEQEHVMKAAELLTNEDFAGFLETAYDLQMKTGGRSSFILSGLVYRDGRLRFESYFPRVLKKRKVIQKRVNGISYFPSIYYDIYYYYGEWDPYIMHELEEKRAGRLDPILLSDEEELLYFFDQRIKRDYFQEMREALSCRDLRQDDPEIILYNSNIGRLMDNFEYYHNRFEQDSKFLNEDGLRAIADLTRTVIDMNRAALKDGLFSLEQKVSELSDEGPIGKFKKMLLVFLEELCLYKNTNEIMSGMNSKETEGACRPPYEDLLGLAGCIMIMTGQRRKDVEAWISFLLPTEARAYMPVISGQSRHRDEYRVYPDITDF